MKEKNLYIVTGCCTIPSTTDPVHAWAVGICDTEEEAVKLLNDAVLEHFHDLYEDEDEALEQMETLADWRDEIEPDTGTPRECVVDHDDGRVYCWEISSVARPPRPPRPQGPIPCPVAVDLTGKLELRDDYDQAVIQVENIDVRLTRDDAGVRVALYRGDDSIIPNASAECGFVGDDTTEEDS